MPDQTDLLPTEPVDRVIKPVIRFLHVEAASGVVLLGATLLALGLAGFLAACQSIRDVQDAIEGKSDEGEMLSAAPAKGPTLSLPPDYNLRPPVAGAGTSDPRAAAQTARARTFNSSGAAGTATPAAASTGGASPGEQAFTRQVHSNAGGAPPPNTRQAVESETSSVGERDRVLVEKLLTWKDGDAAKEAATAQPGSQTVSQAPADETSPVVIRQRRGLLDALF